VNLLARLKEWWTPTDPDSDMPDSMVLLLRQPHFFTLEELQQAGERSWSKRFDGTEDPMYFVMQNGRVTIIKAGTLAINLLHSPTPYLEDVEYVAKQLPRDEQRRAWLAHTAWAALDNLSRTIAKADSYAGLAKFALHLSNENCAGIYLPKEQIMMPNDGTAEEGLHLLIRKQLLH
jgi:hypothetical protein